MRRIALLLAGLVVAGCTQAGLYLANAPAKLNDITREQGVVYAEDVGLALDIYVPPEAESRTLPVIVYIHGGRWTNGDKDAYPFVGAALAKKGYVVVVPDYRKYPAVRFPAFAEDAARAVAWTHANIGSYGGNGRRIFLMGHSAGAHIGALLAVDQSYLREAGTDPSVVKAFAGLAGPYAFTPDAPDLEEIFGPPERYSQMQATSFVDSSDPPMLLLRGADDTVVGDFNARRLAAALKEEGVPVEIINYEGVDHLEIVGALTWFWRGKAPVLDDVAAFFDRYG